MDGTVTDAKHLPYFPFDGCDGIQGRGGKHIGFHWFSCTVAAIQMLKDTAEMIPNVPNPCLMTINLNHKILQSIIGEPHIFRVNNSSGLL